MADSTNITQNASNDASVGTGAWSNPENIETDGVNYASGGSYSGNYTASEFKEVKIVKADGSIGSDNQASGEGTDGTPTDYNFGGASELWSESWTYEDINDADFGCVVRMGQDGSSGSNYLKAQDFGFDIPAGATINGIIVTVKAEDLNEGGGYHTAQVYYIKITIYYTEAAGAPVISTQAVSAIGGLTATGNGSIDATGGANATARGFVYDTETHTDPGDTAPASSDYAEYTSESGDFGIDTFSATLTGLSGETEYFVRAWAQNENGYAYGDEVSFTTLDPWFNRPVENVEGTTADPDEVTTIYAEDVLNLQERVTEIEDNPPVPSAVFVKLNSTDTTTNFNAASLTAIEWDTETIDEGGEIILHDTVTNPQRITVGADGYYRGFVNLSFYSTVQRAAPLVQVRVNGSTILSEEARHTYIRSSGGTNYSTANFEFIANLVDGDYIEIVSKIGGASGTVVLTEATVHVEKY